VVRYLSKKDHQEHCSLLAQEMMFRSSLEYPARHCNPWVQAVQYHAMLKGLETRHLPIP